MDDKRRFNEGMELMGYTTYEKGDCIDFQTILQVMDCSKSTLYDKLRAYHIKPKGVYQNGDVYKGIFLYDKNEIEEVLFYNEIYLEGLKSIYHNEETQRTEIKK